jgi:hypothetical protein
LQSQHLLMPTFNISSSTSFKKEAQKPNCHSKNIDAWCQKSLLWFRYRLM